VHGKVAKVSEDDRVRWDERYARRAAVPGPAKAPPPFLVTHADVFPTAGSALELACGQGDGAVWLAGRGMEVWGVDVSPVAIGQAQELARRSGVSARCRFDVVDLDLGLPAGPPVDVILCHRFRDRRLDQAITGRLAPGGLLAVTALSEVGASPGCFRVAAGELHAAFAELEIIAAGEGRGEAWLLAKR
jgi:SAM-dependent methyltransferase